MTFDPDSGRIVFPEIGLAVDASVTRTQFLRLPIATVHLPRVRHDPSFRYQLPAVPQPDSALYVILRFDYERLAAMSLFHHAARFDNAATGGSEALETARKSFHEQWLASQFGVVCQRYRWGTVSSHDDREARSTSILVEYARTNAWRAVGRTAGRLWGAAANRRSG